MIKLHLNFPIAAYSFFDGSDQILYPLQDLNTVFIDTEDKGIVENFSTALSNHFSDRSDYLALGQYDLRADFEIEQLTVQIGAEMLKDRAEFQPFSVELQYLKQKNSRGFWLLIPMLGKELFCSEEDRIEKLVKETFITDFLKHNRAKYVQGIFPYFWFKNLKLIQQKVKLSIDQKNNVNAEHSLISKISSKLKFKYSGQHFGLGTAQEELSEAFRNSYSNALLVVGKTGIGKTSLIRNHILNFSDGCIFIECPATAFFTQLSEGSGWQENLSKFCQELAVSDAVLYIDNFAELFEMGQYEGNNSSLGEYLLDFISRDVIRFVSECTEEKLAYLETIYPGLGSKFRKITVHEPAEKELFEIVLKKIQFQAAIKNIKVSADAIEEIISLCKRFSPYSGFPAKPLRILENLMRSLPIAAELVSDDVIKAYCEETSLPEFIINPSIPFDSAFLKRLFEATLFGQTAAIEGLCDILSAIKSSLLRPAKPIASLLFVGPTGVGKTALAKKLAEIMFGNSDRMLRFDMSEYSSFESILRLRGDFNNKGELPSALIRQPFSVLLFDEIEKANPMFNDLLLQILGEGRMSTPKGHTVSFCSAIIILTSNIGAETAQNPKIGWNKSMDSVDIQSHYDNEIRNFFRPEIYNRIDRIIPFKNLNPEIMHSIVRQELNFFQHRSGISDRQIELNFSEELIDLIAREGFDKKYGARALQRYLREKLVIPISRLLNQISSDDKISINVYVTNAEIQFDIFNEELPFDMVIRRLRQNEYLDLIADLCRQIHQLKEGYFFTQLINRLDNLLKLKSENKKFWSNKEYVNQLETYELFIRETVALQEAIEKIKIESGLLFLKSEIISDATIEVINKIDQDFKELKKDLYRLLDEDADYIKLGIYLNPKRNGNMLKPIQLYADILEANAFEFSIKSVWYNAEIYNSDRELLLQEFELEEADDLKNAKVIIQENGSKLYQIKRKLKQYQKKDFDRFNHSESLILIGNEQLVGFEFEIKGPAVYLFFAQEQEIHSFEFEANKYDSFYLKTYQKDEKTKTDLHKLNFDLIAKKPRRKYGLRTVSDSDFDFSKKETSPANYATFLNTMLNKIFDAHLNEILI